MTSRATSHQRDCRRAGGGSGPEARTNDGCSVELYRRLPYMGELDDLRDLLRAGRSLLELGCGAGRLTRKLLEWGLRVTAVDDSPQMLALLPVGAAPVVSTIESLSLRRRFDIALLASCLVNPLRRHGFDAFAWHGSRRRWVSARAAGREDPPAPLPCC